MAPPKTPPKGASATAPPKSNTTPRYALWYRAHAREPWRAIGTGETEAQCTAMIVDAGRNGMKGDWTTLPVGEGPPKSQVNGHAPTLFDPAPAEVQTSAPPSPDQAALVVRVAEYLSALERGRRAYDKADILFAKLLQDLHVGQVIDLPDGRQLELVDNYATSNVSWKPAGVRRFELKPLTRRREAMGRVRAA